MTLIATPGAVDANSYCSVARAKVLLNDRLDATAWIVAPMLEQEQSLIWATRLIEQQARWTVTPTTTTQALWWPVSDAVDAYGVAIPSTSIPVFLERATAVYAFFLWEAWHNRQDPRLKRLDMGSVEMEWIPGGPSPQDELPAEVQRELLPYGLTVGGGRIPVVRV